MGGELLFKQKKSDNMLIKRSSHMFSDISIGAKKACNLPKRSLRMFLSDKRFASGNRMLICKQGPLKLMRFGLLGTFKLHS